MAILRPPVPPSRLVPHLLSMAIALMAIVALPLCLPHEVAPGLDADERTITESRDVVEIVTTPGVHLLHQEANAQVADACSDCAAGPGFAATHDGDGVSHPNDSRVPHDDVGPRVAVMPALRGVNGMDRTGEPAHSDPPGEGAVPPGESPPPRRATA